MKTHTCADTKLCISPGCVHDFDDVVDCINGDAGHSKPCTLTPALIDMGRRRARELRAAAFRRMFARLRPGS